MTADIFKSVPLVFMAVLLQLAVFSPIEIAGGGADVVLVAVAVIALLAGSIVGAVTGFWAGFLLDTATLGTLGFSSLLLTLVGYWSGRYGETAGGDRARAPLLALAAVTAVYALGGFLLSFMLGEPTSARWMLFDTLVPQVALNVLLTLPVYAVCRRLFAARDRLRTAEEVELLG
ncbi:MAG: rod shape-determining protein MreD [Thermoleophilia bacterium]|nr:rod shape-determining protein MreD [Thermoleophilia bacterium]